MRNTSILVAIIAALSGAACSKSDKASDPAPSATKTADSQAVLPVFTGTLDAETITAANGLVQPFDAWSTGFAKLKSKMGEPTLVEENRYYWGAMKGDSCTYVYVSQDNEAEFFKDKPDPQDMVGTVAKAETVDKSSMSAFETCAKAAGVKAEDLEDPNAPAPSEDGVATLDDFRAGIAGAKSKWVGKTITVEAKLLSVSTSTSTGSDESTTTVSLVNEVGSPDSIYCDVLDASQVEGLSQGATLKVSGIASASFGGTLQDCALSK